MNFFVYFISPFVFRLHRDLTRGPLTQSLRVLTHCVSDWYSVGDSDVVIAAGEVWRVVIDVQHQDHHRYTR